MTKSKRLLVEYEEELWEVASLRSTKATVVTHQMWWPPEARLELHMRDFHRTISRPTGKAHDTYDFEDGTKLAIYPDGLRISGALSFGNAADLLERIRPLLEQQARMVRSFVPNSVTGWRQLSMSSTSAAFAKQMGFDAVKLREKDVVVGGEDVQIRLVVQPKGQPVPDWIPAEHESISADFNERLEIAFIAYS